MSARTLSHSPTTVVSLDTLAEAPQGPLLAHEPEPEGRYEGSSFEESFDPSLNTRSLSEAPWKMEADQTLARSPSGI